VRSQYAACTNAEALVGKLPSLGTDKKMTTPTIEECNAHAAEYRTMASQQGISVQRATALMGASSALLALAYHLNRISEIEKLEQISN
jgi:uncharacterized protein YdbL (DUF1318 family)